MKSFSYRGYRENGSSCKGLIEADSAKAAREMLVGNGIFVDCINDAGKVGRPGFSLSLSQRAILYRELASLVKSGMPLVTALGALLKTSGLIRSSEVLAAVRDKVREGSSLAAAMEQASAGINSFETATIEVAERSASLEPVLEQLATFLEAQEMLKQRIMRAMIYPVLVMLLGVLVGIVMLGVLLPRTQAMIGATGDLPGLTRLMIHFADMLFPWGLLVGSLLVLTITGWWHRARKKPDLCLRIDRFLFCLPLYGRGYQSVVSIRFARTLSLLLHAGVSPVEGVPLAAKATGSAWCEQLSNQAAENIRHGRSLEQAIADITPVADALCGWIGVGEMGADLARLLDHAADRCDRLFEHFLSKSLALLEPLLLLIIGVFVLLITLSVLLPVFSLTDRILQ